MIELSRRRLLIAGTAAVIAPAALAPHAFVPRAAAAGDDSLMLYNGQHRQTTAALVAAFTKATGIAVTLRNGESPELASQIMEEGERSPADLFYSEQSPPIAALAEKGLLLPVAPDALHQIPAGLAAADGTWIGTSIRTRAIAYNRKLVAAADLPDSILDVATPAWQDKVAYAVKDGFQEQIMAIARLRGRDAALAWLKAIKQVGRVYAGNGAAMKAVEAGEIPLALVNNYYWYAQAREAGGGDRLNSALHYVRPGDPGALATISAAGIVKTTKRAELAQRFIAFMVSEAGQTAIVGSVAEYPVRPGIVSPFPLKPLAEIGTVAVSAADMGSALDAYALEREAGMV